jgi:signal transduction histidine kinase
MHAYYKGVLYTNSPLSVRIPPKIGVHLSVFSSIMSGGVTAANQMIGFLDRAPLAGAAVLPMPHVVHESSDGGPPLLLDDALGVPGDPATRRWLARELHDTVGTTLASMLLEIELLKRREGHTPAKNELECLQAATRAVLSSVRKLVSGLRDEPSDVTGFADTLFAVLERFERTTAMRTLFVTEEGWPVVMNGRAAHHLLRIVSEALENIRRHSNARSVEITLQGHSSLAVLTVRDDGQGLHPTPDGHGYGLTGMQEYAVLAGADLEIESVPEHGTTIRVTFPLENL